jgi:hypothetical protein
VVAFAISCLSLFAYWLVSYIPKGAAQISSDITRPLSYIGAFLFFWARIS